MQFEINQTTATIISLNARTEKHGAEKLVPALDIGFRITVDNAMLDMLDIDLKPSHYKKAEAKQGELIEDLRALKFKSFDYPFKWKYEGVGYEIYMDYGMNGDLQLHFTGNTVDKLKVECKEGGSVIISGRIITHPTEEEVGKLYALNGNEVSLSLMAPSREDKDDDAQENLI